jgi:tRNA modification GTPase
VIEISSHGGTVILNKILDLMLKQGARLAAPGEFSLRAFLNGRLDLMQVEAIAGLVEAKSEQALYALSRQLQGVFSKQIETLSVSLEEVVTRLEAELNFPEDELGGDYTHINRTLRTIAKTIDAWLAKSERSRVFKDGLRCVICGKANVGKSTLFNRLLKEERVIVTHIAGTTRDVVEETINIRGVPLRIFDTAGILDAKDLITKEAMERSLAALAAADIVLFMFDYARSLSKEDKLLLEKVKDKQAVFVINKSDLTGVLDTNYIASFRKPVVKISALKNIGISDLEAAIYTVACRNNPPAPTDMLFLTRWQRQILEETSTAIKQCLDYAHKGYTIDFVHYTLRPALERLAQLTGKNINEKILNDIFSRFCIGK